MQETADQYGLDSTGVLATERFEARTEAQKGITSPDGDFGD